MGVELDVLVGHPEHDLLFVAVQVARVAGLKNPSHAVFNFHNQRQGFKTQLEDLGPLSFCERDARKVPTNTWMFDESRAYAMLLRGNAPASEPFRKWVTEEVLPSIRKTGSYNAADSANPIAQGVMDELKAVRGEVVELRAIIAKLVEAQEQKPSLWTQGQPSVSSYQVPMRA